MIKELTESNHGLQEELEESQKNLEKLYEDAEQMRSVLHKEIKEYRHMKRKLRDVIVEFQKRLSELMDRETARELQESLEQANFQEQLQ